MQGLLNEVKEKNKCKDKAVLTCTLVYNPRSCDNLRKSVELEIKVRISLFSFETPNVKPINDK